MLILCAQPTNKIEIAEEEEEGIIIIVDHSNK